LLLASARVVPEKLQEHGFDYQYPELQAALTAVLQP
jgi:NAD dependent epimerase/dehydratase family enzyme